MPTPLSSKFSGINFITSMAADVYACGYEVSPTDTAAVYWKNGSKTVLPVPTGSAECTSIAFSGNDVYATGDVKPGGCYWKNGVYSFLAKNFFPQGITVDGADVYVSGLIDSQTGGQLKRPFLKTGWRL